MIVFHKIHGNPFKQVYILLNVLQYVNIHYISKLWYQSTIKKKSVIFSTKGQKSL